MESMPRRPSAETPPISLGDASALMPLQAVLALTHFHALHPDMPIDVTHPNAVDRTIRNEAMSLWLEGDDQSLSTRFREYAETHPTETVSIDDEGKIEEFFKEFSAPEEPTVH